MARLPPANPGGRRAPKPWTLSGSLGRAVATWGSPELSWGWPEKVAKAPVRRGRPPKGAAEGIDHHPVVPGGHRPFPRRRTRLGDTD